MRQYLLSSISCIFLALGFFLTQCGFKSDLGDDLKTGMWRGTLDIQGHTLPFNFEITQKEPRNYLVHFINGEERIPVDEVRVLGDSLFITMNVFDAQLKARIKKNTLVGSWCKNYTPGYVVPFRAEYGDSTRFDLTTPAVVDLSGKWRVNFSDDSLDAVGIFDQKGSRLLGTFLTSKGDYRYLQGVVRKDSLYLSTFDGEHAFLFTAASPDGQRLNGTFRSGPTWLESWTAVKDSTATLTHPDSLTYLKPGYSKLRFSFPDLNGRTVSLTDEKYRNKVVIVQIFGTWCPNCLDETKFLANWYEHQKQLPVEIIGLAYERLPDFSYAKNRLNKMITKLDVKYDFLIAGTSDKLQAAETLPMLNHIMSFPTTIFIDHKGVIRRIHTGFSGPGTGTYYQHFVEDFEQFTNKLISERLSDTTMIAP